MLGSIPKRLKSSEISSREEHQLVHQNMRRIAIAALKVYRLDLRFPPIISYFGLVHLCLALGKLVGSPLSLAAKAPLEYFDYLEIN